MMSSVSAAIVGAGPTGLLLALELARRGVSCRIFDAQDAPMSWDRATVIHSRSLDVFESLDVVEPILATGLHCRGLQIWSDGAGVARLDLTGLRARYDFDVAVGENVTERVLEEALERRGITVERGQRVVGISDHDDAVQLQVEASDGSCRSVGADWVVGCDGYHSTVRMAIGASMDGYDDAEISGVFDARIVGDGPPQDYQVAFVDDQRLFLLALPDGIWRATGVGAR